MNKILFFSNQGLAPLHLGIELEVLSKLISDKNNQVVSITCNAKLPGCYFNPTKNILGCSLCESRTNFFHKKIDGVKDFSIVNKPEPDLKVPFFENLFELEQLNYKGVNIGRGIASSLISLTRDFEVQNPIHKYKIKELYHLSISSYEILSNEIQKHRPNQVYFFNGRFAECHVLLQICKREKIDFFTLEVAALGKYLVFKNALPHSIKERDRLMSYMWESANKNKRVEVAKDFFEKKRKGVFQEQYMHTSQQKLFKLPEKWDNNKRNVAIFNSSEDEMKVIEEWRHDFYSSQNEVIGEICEFMAQNKDFHFYLRVHPNLGVLENSQVRQIKTFNYPNLTIIHPHEEIDSYALVENSEKVITFGSTIGIESTFLQKPSIMFGRSFYENTDSVYTPKAYSELFDLIQTENLVPKPKENTYSYGYFVSSFGTAFERFEYKDKNNAFYNGEKIKRGYFSTIKYLFLYLKYVPNWFRLTKVFTGKSLKIKHLTKLLHQIKH